MSDRVTAPDSDQIDQAIHPVYCERLAEWARSHRYEGRLAPEPDRILVEARVEGVTLAALIDPTVHAVRRVAYRGRISTIQRGLLEALGAILIDRPILEVGDHAVVRLEFLLREPAWPRPVAGIVLPQNADPAFRLPLNLARGLLAAYREATGYSQRENFYDPPPSPAWLALSRAERLERLRAALAEIWHSADLTPADLTSVDLVGDSQVVFDVRGDLPSAVIAGHLMRIEAHLKSRLEETLQVQTREREDSNRIRRL